MATSSDLPPAPEQERLLVGHTLDWSDDKRYRTIETDATSLKQLIDGTRIGQASPKAATYTYAEIYGLLAEFDLQTRVQLVKDEGIRLGRDIYIPKGSPTEFYEWWLTDFNAVDGVYAEDDYLRVHHD